jgi:hypothetical protein
MPTWWLILQLACALAYPIKIDGDINLPYNLPYNGIFAGISTGMVSHILGITYTRIWGLSDRSLYDF